jgi:hypothetical protein
LNIIFTETLHKMEFDFNKMTACDEPFLRGRARQGYVPHRSCMPTGHLWHKG